MSSDRVIGEATRVVLVASDGRRGTANVVRRAPLRDLVLLATDLALPPAYLESARDQHQGEIVLASTSAVRGFGISAGESDPSRRDESALNKAEISAAGRCVGAPAALISERGVA